jgi:hypothetical protein
VAEVGFYFVNNSCWSQQIIFCEAFDILSIEEYYATGAVDVLNTLPTAQIAGAITVIAARL